jgi:hypothetical protein
VAASALDDDLLAFSEREFPTRNGPRIALVAAPRRRIRLGRPRLDALRAGDYESPINDKLLVALDHVERPVHVIVFRAGGVTGQAWAFEDSLTDEECVELGYFLIRSQLQLYVEAARRGVLTVIGVEFGPRELAAYERGTDRLADQLEREIAEGADSSIGRFNLWLIDHIGLWTPLPLEQFLAERAPEAAATAERHQRQIRRLLDELPPTGT